MPKSLMPHTILLVAAVTGVYLWEISPFLSPFTLQLVAVLVLVYAAFHWFRPKKKTSSRSTIPVDLTLLTAMILLLVTNTGSLASPFFFLLYFLLFAVALLYQIESTLILTGTLLMFFLLLPNTDLSDLGHLSTLSALLMITPLAIFTGHQKELLIEEEQKSAALSGHISHEETDTLTFLSLNLKNTLASSLDKLSLVIPKTKIHEAREDLQVLYQDLRSLYRSADELQQMIDQETDKS